MVQEITEHMVGGAVGGAISGCVSPFLIYLILVALVVVAVKGFYRVPIGAKGVVIWMGRRTGDVRDEGITWMPPLLGKILILYVRERQVDVPKAAYHTSDRARLEFKTTVRVVVEEPTLLLEQGPGTFGPFLREGKATLDEGAEERHVALRRLMENSIREAVHSLSIHDVMFGGASEGQLQQRIFDQLSRTTGRWGLGVREIWLTEVEANDDELERAVQSEVRESMEGKGRLAAHKAEVAKGALFNKVASEMMHEAAAAGRQVSFQEAIRFLQGNYQNERELEIAVQGAKNVSSFANKWMLQVEPPTMSVAPPSRLAAREPHRLPSKRQVLTLGREGEIRVEGDGVSRRHAQVELREGQVLITDLGSTNGTWVGEERLPNGVTTAVTPSSRIRLGKHITFSGHELLEVVRNKLRG